MVDALVEWAEFINEHGTDAAIARADTALAEREAAKDRGKLLDDQGRVRIDDWEMAPDVQKAVFDVWPQVTTETFDAHADFAGYQSDFLKNFGFGVAGIDYEAPTEVERPIEDA